MAEGVVEQSVSDAPASRIVQILVRTLSVVAVALAALACLALVLGGIRLALGPIRISATDPSRVALQAALVWLVAVFITPRLRARAPIALLSLALVLVTAAADSLPRRVGDGAEYLAMAINVAHGRPPALSPDERRDMVTRFEATPGFVVASLNQPLTGFDGRQDFPHFWLFSVLVAPVVAVADALGVHPNHAFTVFNGALLLLLSWWLIAKQHALVAALLVAGPLIWWTDKAHAEVFLFVLIAGAVALVESQPALALIAAALAAAQNSGLLPVFAAVVVYVVVCRPRGVVPFAALAAAALIAALPAVYYAWHLGTWSPLAGTVERGMPSARALLTVLVDPNLGVVPYAPVLVALALIGFAGQPRRTRTLVGLLFVVMLIVVSRPVNLNHGGSPGMSRYALWLIACTVPLIAQGTGLLSRSRPLVMALGLMLVVATSWYAFRPELVDRGGSTPSLGATMIWTRWPWLDNPLPEVFAERVSGVDGVPPVPIAVTGCSKALIRGDGAETWWPFPCNPRQAPAECVAAGALCYANGARFMVAPNQPAFRFDPSPDVSWTVSRRAHLTPLLQRLGRDAHYVRQAASRRFSYAEEISTPTIVEGNAATAVWVQPAVPAKAYIRVRVSTPSTVEIWRASSATQVSASTVSPGEREIRLPFDERMLVLIVDAP
jgi:hypothetical protein